jgi:hypothetical protein
MGVQHPALVGKDVLGVETVLLIVPNMERGDEDVRVQEVTRSLRERLLPRAHIREEPQQLVVRMERDPDGEVQAARDLEIAVRIDAGAEVRLLEQGVEPFDRDALLRGDAHGSFSGRSSADEHHGSSLGEHGSELVDGEEFVPELP